MFEHPRTQSSASAPLRWKRRARTELAPALFYSGICTCYLWVAVTAVPVTDCWVTWFRWRDVRRATVTGRERARHHCPRPLAALLEWPTEQLSGSLVLLPDVSTRVGVVRAAAPGDPQTSSTPSLFFNLFTEFPNENWVIEMTIVVSSGHKAMKWAPVLVPRHVFNVYSKLFFIVL